MATSLTWIGSGAGTVAVIALQPVMVIPVLLLVVPIVAWTLLVTILALVAVYSSERDRRSAAEKILVLLLATLPGGKQDRAEHREWGTHSRVRLPSEGARGRDNTIPTIRRGRPG